MISAKPPRSCSAAEIPKKQGGNVKLVPPSKFAVQTLRLVGVLNLFEIFDNDDAAVESFV